MERKLIKNIKAGEKVLVEGWIEHIRDQKTMQFVIMKDISGKVQITVEKQKLSQMAQEFKELIAGSVVSVEGYVQEAPFVKLGGVEILPEKMEVLSHAKVSPIDSDSAQDLRMDYRWIDLRDEKKTFVFKVQTTLEQALQKWFVDHGFMSLHTPHITAFSSEGGSEVFEIKNYFGKKAYLTQSSQLFKQCAMASGFDRTFEIGPCFRANKSFTSRHDTEFIQMDAEISYIKSHHDVMTIEEELIKYFCEEIEKIHGEDIKKYYGIEFSAPKVPFPRIALRDAYKMLAEEKGYEVPEVGKEDLGERLICELVKEKYGSDFVFITDFPFAARAFYTMKREDEPELSKSFDLLYKGLEITSGAQREHRAQILKEQIAEKGIEPKDMEFYTQFFEYGCPPHGGFGLGLTRFLTKLFEVPSVKDVTFLFRGPDRIAP